MSVLIHQHWEASKQGRPELEHCSESPPGGTVAIIDLELLFCCQGKASSVSVIPTSVWEPPEHSLCYSKLWNFTSIKIWMRYIGLYSQMVMWYKSPIKCHNEWKLIWEVRQTCLELRYLSSVRAHSNSGNSLLCELDITSTYPPLALIVSLPFPHLHHLPLCQPMDSSHYKMESGDIKRHKRWSKHLLFGL